MSSVRLGANPPQELNRVDRPAVSLLICLLYTDRVQQTVLPPGLVDFRHHPPSGESYKREES